MYNTIWFKLHGLLKTYIRDELSLPRYFNNSTMAKTDPLANIKGFSVVQTYIEVLVSSGTGILLMWDSVPI